MKKSLTVLLAATFLLCFVAHAEAIQPNSSGKWAASWLDSDYCCNPTFNSCENLQVDEAPIWGPPNYISLNIYLVAVEVDAIDGSRFGLGVERPENLYFYGWTKPVGTTQDATAGWPGNGEGIDLTWGSSQTGPFVVMGFLEMVAYGSARLCLCEDPRVGYAEWRDGANSTRRQIGSVFGCVGFGPGKLGYNPCGRIVAVQQTSWGAIKAMYRS